MQKNTRITFNVFMSFLIWTSVFVMGVLVSATVFRVFLASGLTAYHLVHP